MQEEEEEKARGGESLRKIIIKDRYWDYTQKSEMLT